MGSLTASFALGVAFGAILAAVVISIRTGILITKYDFVIQKEDEKND